MSFFLLSTSNAHAQTLEFGSSNATGSMTSTSNAQTLEFGSSNATISNGFIPATVPEFPMMEIILLVGIIGMIVVTKKRL